MPRPWWRYGPSFPAQVPDHFRRMYFSFLFELVSLIAFKYAWCMPTPGLGHATLTPKAVPPLAEQGNTKQATDHFG